MDQRQLDFQEFAEIHAEVDRLHREGYGKAGQWDLAQGCDHLTFFMREALDGPTIRVPWLIKLMFGRLVLRRILKTRRMRPGVRSPQDPLPEPGSDEAAAVERFRQTLERLRTHPGEMHASRFFSPLTPQQCRDLQMIHCAHHLGFLVPKPTAR